MEDSGAEARVRLCRCGFPFDRQGSASPHEPGKTEQVKECRPCKIDRLLQEFLATCRSL
jgi:hypothetical protein